MKTQDPWAEMDKIMAANKRPEGNEWFTVAQYVERYGMSRSASLDRLRKMVKAGTLDHWRGDNQRREQLFRIKPTK